MEESVPDRYEHNPMLVLVENYILDALGKLEPEKERKLAEIVCRSFGGSDWREILRSQFNLPNDKGEGLRALWNSRCAEMDARQEDFSVEEFAQQTADDIMKDLGN